MKKDFFPVALVGILAAIPVIILIMKMHNPSSSGGIDLACMHQCTQRGLSGGYCQMRCSLDPAAQAQSGDPADPVCMNNCEDAGHDPGYCQKACNYN